MDFPPLHMRYVLRVFTLSSSSGLVLSSPMVGNMTAAEFHAMGLLVSSNAKAGRTTASTTSKVQPRQSAGHGAICAQTRTHLELREFESAVTSMSNARSQDPRRDTHMHDVGPAANVILSLRINIADRCCRNCVAPLTGVRILRECGLPPPREGGWTAIVPASTRSRPHPKVPCRHWTLGSVRGQTVHVSRGSRSTLVRRAHEQDAGVGALYLWWHCLAISMIILRA